MLEVDSHQKVIMKFSLKDVNDASSSSIQVHQVSNQWDLGFLNLGFSLDTRKNLAFRL